MWSKPLTGREIVMASVAVALAVWIVSPHPLTVILGPLVLMIVWRLGKPWFFRRTLKTRLAVEVGVLAVLLVCSSFAGMPRFYSDQIGRCQELARRAREGAKKRPRFEAFLNREATWFSRRANDLRKRGCWVGFVHGPRLEDPEEVDYAFEFGTLESIEKHEKRLNEKLEAP